VDNLQAKQQTLAELRAQVQQLEAEIRAAEGSAVASQWPPQGFYGAYYANSGFMLGGIAAVTSLLLNIIGAPLAGKSPLELIRVYLTFPLGGRALELGSERGTLILLLGCCLYVATGVVLGVPFFVLLARLAGEGGLKKRMILATALSLLLWAINFYLILTWLQPALFGGNWITDPAILPPWVAAGTHLIFGWTLALLYPLGKFVPYRSPSHSRA
jgi:hypothetical protein